MKPQPKEEPEPQSATFQALYDRVRAHVGFHEEHFLAMNATRAGTPCQVCVDEYVPRGVWRDDPLLKHRHFTFPERDEDVALDVAIADAQKRMRSPLEAKAKAPTPEQRAERARFVAGMRASIFDALDRSGVRRHREVVA